MKCAGIDVGSNSVRLMIADVSDNKILTVLEQQVKETRLGEGFVHNMLLKDPMNRTISVIALWQQYLSAKGIDNITIFATAAVRDAKNGDVFIRKVQDHLGLSVRLLSGEEEAYYSYIGAISGFDNVACPMVIDIGGGSTELVSMVDDKLVAISSPVGCIRVKEFGYSIADIKNIISAKIGNQFVNNSNCTYIGVGGTITTALAIRDGISEYSRDAVQGKAMTRDDLESMYNEISAMSLDDRNKIIGLPQTRIDIIDTGLMIILALFDMFKIDSVYVSDCGILDGILSEIK